MLQFTPEKHLKTKWKQSCNFSWNKYTELGILKSSRYHQTQYKISVKNAENKCKFTTVIFLYHFKSKLFESNKPCGLNSATKKRSTILFGNTLKVSDRMCFFILWLADEQGNGLSLEEREKYCCPSGKIFAKGSV